MIVPPTGLSLAKETLRAAIFISLTLLRIQLENLFVSSLHNLPDHNKDYNEADDNVHLVDVAVHSDRLSSIMNQ